MDYVIGLLAGGGGQQGGEQTVAEQATGANAASKPLFSLGGGGLGKALAGITNAQQRGQTEIASALGMDSDQMAAFSAANQRAEQERKLRMQQMLQPGQFPLFF